MNDRMKAYLRKEVNEALEIMIRDNSNGHVFDFDSEGLFVFVMAVLPRHEFDKAQLFTTPSEPHRAETPVRHETETPPKAVRHETEGNYIHDYPEP